MSTTDVQHFVGIRYGLVEENLKVVRTSLTDLKEQMKDSKKALKQRMADNEKLSERHFLHIEKKIKELKFAVDKLAQNH